MKKFLSVSFLTFVAVFLMATAVLAAVERAPLYDSSSYTPGVTCLYGSDETNGPTLGSVFMDFNQEGQLVAEISLEGASPNTAFDIWVNQYPGDCPVSWPTEENALTTNEQGYGNAFVVLDAVPGASHFWISVVGGGQILRSTAVVLE